MSNEEGFKNLVQIKEANGNNFNFYNKPPVLSTSDEDLIEWTSLSYECFSLFVTTNEDYRGKSFSLPRCCALKYTPDEYTELYRYDLFSGGEVLKKMPCIFAARNDDFKHASENQIAYFGKIMEVFLQNSNLKFNIKLYGFFQQEKINEKISQFRLLYNDLRNQLDENHWSIRKGSLQKILKKFTINLGENYAQTNTDSYQGN